MNTASAGYFASFTHSLWQTSANTGRKWSSEQLKNEESIKEERKHHRRKAVSLQRPLRKEWLTKANQECARNGEGVGSLLWPPSPHALALSSLFFIFPPTTHYFFSLPHHPPFFIIGRMRKKDSSSLRAIVKWQAYTNSFAFIDSRLVTSFCLTRWPKRGIRAAWYFHQSRPHLTLRKGGKEEALSWIIKPLGTYPWAFGYLPLSLSRINVHTSTITTLWLGRAGWRELYDWRTFHWLSCEIRVTNDFMSILFLTSQYSSENQKKNNTFEVKFGNSLHRTLDSSSRYPAPM